MRLNVNDPVFVRDEHDVRQGDYRMNNGTDEQDGRDVMVDLYAGQAYIFDGMRVMDGTMIGFYVDAGRARDNAGRSIIIPVAVDNIPPAAPLVTNYVAVRHRYARAGADQAVKTGLAYRRIISDDYELRVSVAPFDEGAGWVRLARVDWVAGAWVYNQEWTAIAGVGAGLALPQRSRQNVLAYWSEMFAYNGLPMGPVFMDRHTLVGLDQWRCPYDLIIYRVEVDVGIAGANNMTVDLFQNGAAHPGWPPGMLTLVALDTNALWYDPEGTAAAALQYYKDELIQIQLTPGAGAPTDIVVNLAGVQTGNA